jgi:hypothetical protein
MFFRAAIDLGVYQAKNLPCPLKSIPFKLNDIHHTIKLVPPRVDCFPHELSPKMDIPINSTNGGVSCRIMICSLFRSRSTSLTINCKTILNVCRLGQFWPLAIAINGLLVANTSEAAGTWTSLASSPPVGVNNCILMSDGTVLGMNGAGQCVKLTPDIHGSYINGTWSGLATMNNSRLFFSSQLLTNGNLWVAGGEDGSGGSSSELYGSLNNVWTLIPAPASGYPDFSDSISEILPDGNPLVCPVYTGTACLIYNVFSNNWQTAASCNASQDESDWVKLPGDSILTIDAFSQNSEHYVPSLNQWITDGGVPVPLYDSSLGELGSGHLLPNGKAFFVGSTTNTAIYTPGATVTNAGSWVAGPAMVFGANQLGQSDAPSAMMANGKILCCLGPSATYNAPCYFYEYDYTVNTFTQVSAPGGGSTLNDTAPFGTSMLDLPDGTVLFMDGQNTGTLYIYTPDGTPLAAGQPVIDSITENLDGSYQLTGTGLNGISEGATYGDDEQMNGNYPLVRLTNNVSGDVYYARTYNWNSTSVQTGSRVVTTQFALPQNLPAGTYSLVVVAVGNASTPVSFTNTPPAAPTGLTGTAGNAQAVLSWNAVSGATAYNLKRFTTVGTPYYATVATMTGTSCTNVGLVNAFTYSYVVTTVSPGGESADSSALLLTPSGPPPVPTGVTATSDTFARIDLAWTPSYAATNYTILRSTSLNGTYTSVASTLNPFYTDTGLVSGTTYYYEISAASTEGTSSNSVAVSAMAEAMANFSFEVPNIGSGNYVYNPSGGFWTFNGASPNGSGIVGNGSAFSNPNAPDGVQAAFVQSYGTISQTLSGFVPGTTYQVRYYAAQRPGYSEAWNVMIDNKVIDSFNPGASATSYTLYTAIFVASAATHTLSLVGTDLAGNSDAVFIDDVQVTIVPPTIPNFSFETPGLGTGIGSYQYNPSGASWTFDGASPNGSGIVGNGSAFNNPNAPLGTQAAFVQAYGTISQSLSGFIPGKTYTLTYAAAQRPGYNETWNVKIDNTVVQSNSPGGTSYATYTANFVATATTETLAFVGTDLAGNADAVFIDDVSIISPLQPVAPVVTLTAPTNNVILIGSVINLTASVVTNGNIISNVQFYYDTTNLIGHDSSLPYSYNWTSPNTGNHSVFARVTYNGGSVADSPAAVITVINTNVNFGFEAPSLGSGTDAYEYDPSGASWTFNGASPNGSGLVGNGSAFGNANAPQGVQAAFVQSYGTISQMLYGFTPGTKYTITYFAAQRPGYSETWNVMIDNKVIAGNAAGGTSYATYTATFTASAFTHTLSFVGTDLAGNSDAVFLDNVRISPTISQVPPSVALASPGNNAVFDAANPVNLAATVTPNGNTIVGVQFYCNTNNLITQVTAPYTYAWSNANAGASTVFARLVFDGSNTVDSSMINITVTNPPPVAQSIGANAQTLSISGIGLANRPYYLDTSLNLTPPVVWTQILTNVSDAEGNILFTNIAPTNAQQYFLISAP